MSELATAITTLNHFAYRGYTNWAEVGTALQRWAYASTAGKGGPGTVTLTEWEAGVIAEALRRDYKQAERKLAILSNSCNLHSDCESANQKERLKGFAFGATHCHDDDCEDCFGK